MATIPLRGANVRLLIVKQGISTSDDLGSINFRFDPVIHSHITPDPSVSIEAGHRHLKLLEKTGIEPVNYLIQIQPLDKLDGSKEEESLKVVSCMIIPGWQTTNRSASRRVNQSILIDQMDIIFKCNIKFLKDCKVRRSSSDSKSYEIKKSHSTDTSNHKIILPNKFDSFRASSNTSNSCVDYNRKETEKIPHQSIKISLRLNRTSTLINWTLFRQIILPLGGSKGNCSPSTDQSMSCCSTCLIS
ncbi:hypothetical protein BY996DRAFT_6991018 [Phakopsora pachyrhizi]|uniref:Expressed protein n=1 Tax=Phakopsora pachyrhizi TaxID=170000 RepID=A0AAV0B848_PHAPC|nr:hypothetical protein BY996DRAFT_6991018 [Phakopsora pachyrhizi]CAH7681494.1 expressed protein [Phakopsora pachyrhizi]